MIKIQDKKTNEFKRDNKQTKMLNKLKSYEDFLNEIAKTFNVKNKNEISLIALTNDDDEIPIKNEEDYIDCLNDIKKYLFYLEKEGQNKPEKRQIDEDFNYNFNIDFSVEEITNNIKRQMKEPEEISDEINIDFDFNKYREDQNSKNKKIFDEFSQMFNSELKEIFSNKGILLTNLITKEKNKFSKSGLNKINTLNKDMNKSKDDLSNLVNDFSQLYNNSLDEISEIILEEINIRFLDEDLELIKTPKEAKYINVKNVTIENIGYKTYKTLWFIKDENKSSKEIIFNPTYLKTKKSIFHLTLDGDFVHGKKESHAFVIKIENPKPNHEYALYLIVKEGEKGARLSKPFKIIVKIKEDPQSKKEEEAEKLYEELNKQFSLNEIFEKNEVINKIINEKFNKDIIKIWIQTRLQEKCMNDVENLFIELNNEYEILNYGFDKQEIINQIVEENLNKDNLKNWAKQKIKIKLESMKAENIYKKFDKIYKLSSSYINKQEIIDIIIKEKFNEEKIGKWIKDKVGNPPPSIGSMEKEVENIFNELDNEFNITSLLDREEIINIIKKLGCDRDKIRKSIIDLL